MAPACKVFLSKMCAKCPEQTSCTNPIRSDSDRIGWHMTFVWSYFAHGFQAKLCPLLRSLFLSFYLSTSAIHLATSPSIHRSVCLPIYHSIFLWFCRPVCLAFFRCVVLLFSRSTFLSVDPSVYLSIALSFSRSTFLSFCLPVGVSFFLPFCLLLFCLSVFLSLSLAPASFTYLSLLSFPSLFSLSLSLSLPLSSPVTYSCSYSSIHLSFCLRLLAARFRLVVSPLGCAGQNFTNFEF